MLLLFGHILILAVSVFCIYMGFTKMIKYIKKFQQYKGEKNKAAICVGMVSLSLFVIFCGLYTIYLEIESFIEVNS
jgi:uncharacterized membrane protein (DUF485 family)